MNNNLVFAKLFTKMISGDFMIIREQYLNRIRPFYESDLAKVITGIRRSGKSVILNQVMDEIRQKTNNILYLNFEKMSDFAQAGTATDLIQYVEKNRKEGKCYIFLDEVQEVEGWARAVKDLRLGNNSIFITGSNSKLLSSEILTLLSGRFVSFRVRPFVYSEIESLMKETGNTCTVNDYLTWGGFPGHFLYDSIEAQKDYLSDLENTIVYNDLIRRYKIRKEVPFRKIVSFVLRNNSRIVSARSIEKSLKSECADVSLNTILKYLSYLKEAYIIDELPQYSDKTKKELAYYCKIYDSDVCFNSLGVTNNRFDLDHNLENVVYNELLYRGYDLKVFDNKGREIDFYASKNGKEYYIQVAYSVLDDKAYQREFSAFKDVDFKSQKILITMDENDYSTSLVRHISMKDFLKMEDF